MEINQQHVLDGLFDEQELWACELIYDNLASFRATIHRKPSKVVVRDGTYSCGTKRKYVRLVNKKGEVGRTLFSVVNCKAPRKFHLFIRKESCEEKYNELVHEVKEQYQGYIRKIQQKINELETLKIK